MFKTHQANIADHARQSIENTADCVRFVLATIKQKTFLVPDIMATKNWRALTPASRKGIEWLKDDANKAFVYRACFAEGLSHADRLTLLTQVPGLGIPKAGFVLQLTIGATGCLDTHNIRNFGLEAKHFVSSGLKTETVLKRARLYVETCEALGGCEFLWNQWCEFITNRYHKEFDDAEHVSRLHEECILQSLGR